jgi:hypothetical protein
VYLHVIGTRRPQQSERAIFCTVPIGTLLSFANELRVIAGRLYIAHRDRQPNYFWTCHYRAGVKLHVRTRERSKWSAWSPVSPPLASRESASQFSMTRSASSTDRGLGTMPLRVLARSAVHAKATPRGSSNPKRKALRATACSFVELLTAWRSVLTEATPTSHEVAEAALAHPLSEKSEAACQRGDYVRDAQEWTTVRLTLAARRRRWSGYVGPAPLLYSLRAAAGGLARLRENHGHISAAPFETQEARPIVSRTRTYSNFLLRLRSNGIRENVPP